jgi:plasmid stabilization system protein ParE
MNIRKTDQFIADLERQFEWYLLNANGKIAESFLSAAEATCELLARHPLLGPKAGFSHPHLRGWRFFVVFRPFKKHILFYEVSGEDIVMRRAMHGHRDFPNRLLER